MDANETALRIANKALIKIGAKTITSLNDITQPNAVIINSIYSQNLQELIEEHPWSFCVNTFTLAQIPLLTPFVDFGDGVNVAYAVPSDFMSLYLVNVPSIIKFEMLKSPYVATNTYAMLTNISTGLMIKYVFLNTDPTTYSEKFVEALACKLAYEACFKISEAAQYAAGMAAAYAKALSSAQAADSKGSSPDEPIQDEWINARLAGATVSPGVGMGLNTGWI
jgi:hypothetical protein